jgi:hypothetical protein
MNYMTTPDKTAVIYTVIKNKRFLHFKEKAPVYADGGNLLYTLEFDRSLWQWCVMQTDTITAHRCKAPLFRLRDSADREGALRAFHAMAQHKGWTLLTKEDTYVPTD